MPLAYVSASLRRLIGLRKRDALTDLPNPADFRTLMDRERGRADRLGQKFSVVAFTPRAEADATADRETLVQILRRRVRLTDDVGWMDAGQLGVILPGTDAAGAWKLADDVCVAFPDHLPPPVCTVYSYPHRWPIGANPSDRPAHGRGVVSLETLFVRPVPMWKRGLDVFGAAAGLVLLAPLLAGIAVVTWLDSPGPVLFRQRRSGLGGRPFVMYKFRSMVIDAEARKRQLLELNEQDGPAFKLKQDPRVTRLGRLLRQTSLDELPQLWNVLRGEMSLVGPRPLPCEEQQRSDRWQQRRLDVTPGLTCIWQVQGRSRVTFADWIRMDLRYIRSHSAALDLALLVLTLPAVILRRGAH
jgi:lipopolysaccharide/colanic/teichoic acid biosynthesis glycosyltransferase